MKLVVKDKTLIGILKFLKIKNKTFQKVIAFIEMFLGRIDDNHLFLIAAGIAFNILLYLMPLLLVAVYFVNEILDVDSVTKFLTDTILQVLPPTESTAKLIESTVKEIYIISNNKIGRASCRERV